MHRWGRGNGGEWWGYLATAGGARGQEIQDWHLAGGGGWWRWRWRSGGAEEGWWRWDRGGWRWRVDSGPRVFTDLETGVGEVGDWRVVRSGVLQVAVWEEVVVSAGGVLVWVRRTGDGSPPRPTAAAAAWAAW